ncbi:MAG: hypothetical protein JXA78_18500 [Anaerolineales bacterium]|nr:hypothetical protein [Anaerolineales bacterium]
MDELELLAFLNWERAEETLDELRARYSVSQVASQQLAILRVDADLGDEIEDIQEVEGVRAVFEGSVPDELLVDLNPTERLFVKAWQMRKGAEAKQRPADMLDWDAEGYEPPDLEQLEDF